MNASTVSRVSASDRGEGEEGREEGKGEGEKREREKESEEMRERECICVCVCERERVRNTGGSRLRADRLDKVLWKMKNDNVKEKERGRGRETKRKRMRKRDKDKEREREKKLTLNRCSGWVRKQSSFMNLSMDCTRTFTFSEGMLRGNVNNVRQIEKNIEKLPKISHSLLRSAASERRER